MLVIIYNYSLLSNSVINSLKQLQLSMTLSISSCLKISGQWDSLYGFRDLWVSFISTSLGSLTNIGCG